MGDVPLVPMDGLTGITVDLGTIIAFLYAVVAVMIIIALYHLMFILVDLRKVMRRFEDMTSQVEDVLMKPLAIADHAVQWVVEFIEQKRTQGAKHHSKDVHTEHHKKAEHSK